MKFLTLYLLFILIISVCFCVFDRTKGWDDFINDVIDYCRNDKIIILKNNDEQETIDTPKYISDFGLGLKNLKERKIHWTDFLGRVKGQVDANTDTRNQINKLLKDLYVGKIKREEEIKAKAVTSVNGKISKSSDTEIDSKAKTESEGANAQDLTKSVLDTIQNEADKTYLYFGKASELLDEILKGTAKSLDTKDVNDLAAIKKLVDDMTKACTPFYKTGFFIFLMILFTVLIIATAVFTALVVRRFMKAKEKPPPITPRV
jgi:hypothetical protein